MCIISGGLDGRQCAGCCRSVMRRPCGRAPRATVRANRGASLVFDKLDLRPCVTLRHRAQQDAGSIPSRTSSRRFLSPKRSREWPFLASNGRAEQNSSDRVGRVLSVQPFLARVFRHIEACCDGSKRGSRRARGWTEAAAAPVLVQVASSGHGAQLNCATLCEERYWTSRTARRRCCSLTRGIRASSLTAPRVLV